MELAGAVFGVTIQRLLPDWLFLSFAAVVLGFTCYKTFMKVCWFSCCEHFILDWIRALTCVD
jgi:hypothetical protein